MFEVFLRVTRLVTSIDDRFLVLKVFINLHLDDVNFCLESVFENTQLT